MQKYAFGAGLACLAAVGFLLAAPVTGQAASACSAPVYNQFDFFVGDWIVKNRAGKVIATDRVTKILKNCVVWEQWSGKTHGAAYTGYAADRGVWHQTWMDDSGTVLLLDAKRIGTSLAFDGTDSPKPGATELDHVVFTPRPNGVVEEAWTVSSDGGKTWQSVFDGFFYRK